MLDKVLFLSLLLLPHTYCSSEASFEALPANPKLGEDVFLVCKLKAPIGDRFHGTTPDLIIDGVSNSQFPFSDIRKHIFDSRYNGFEIADTESLELEGIISIKAINASDLSRRFTCFQTLVNSGENVSITVTLGAFVHTTTSSNTPELTSTINPETTHLPPSTTDTGDATMQSTHIQLAYKQILGTIAIMLVIFFICKIPCLTVFIYKRRAKLNKWMKRRKLVFHVDQSSMQDTAPSKDSKQTTVLEESQQVSESGPHEETQI